MKADEVIARLELAPLGVEGGFFLETYRSARSAGEGRCCGTSIYYLLRGDDRSAWHKVASDEIWYFHAGSAARQLVIEPGGKLRDVLIGPPELPGALPQSVIPAGSWQSAVLLERGTDDWGLFGAAVFPGFEYADFTGGSNDEVIALFPQWEKLIRAFAASEA